MALRRSAVLRLTPDERGPFPQVRGVQWTQPPTTSGRFLKTQLSTPVPNRLHHTPPFILTHDRERMRAFMEARHLFHFHTRKVPEFWKNYRWYYKLGEGLNEWRENRVRNRIEELFMNDACLCTETEAFEVKRVADRLVTLIKDGSRSSRRVLQEFFEVKNWDGGRSPNTWSGVGEAGDMRALYKALDDYPQRFKNRHGNYCKFSITHTPWSKKKNAFMNPDMNRRLTKVVGKVTIVEMVDRDLSLFHRGQLITGDKGADVWDHDKDRPLLDTHRGFHEQPRALEVDEQIAEQEERERRHDKYVVDPAQYLGFQRVEHDEDQGVKDLHQTSLFNNSHTAIKPREGRMNASQDELDEWPLQDLNDIDVYIKNMRMNATTNELYKDENFAKMFPNITSRGWIEKIYKPYMKMSPEKQAEVYGKLENINIHDQTRPHLTMGLPVPKVSDNEGYEEHFRKTWKKKLEYLERYPDPDPRDTEFLGAAQREAFEGKLAKREVDEDEE